MKAGIALAVLFYEIALVAGVAWFLAKSSLHEKAPSEEFALGGRSLSMPVVAVTLAVTVLGTGHILGLFEMSWHMGAAALWFSLANVITITIVCYATGIWMRRIRATTVPEVIENFYGPVARMLTASVMAGVIFGILTIETQGIGIIAATMMGWTIQQGAIAGGILGVLYVVIAGMREIGWINLINAIVMYLGVIVATIFIAFSLDGNSYETVAAVYRNQDQSFMLSIFGTPEILLTFGLGTVAALAFSVSMSQMLLQPAMSAQSEKVVKQSVWIAAFVNGMFGVFAVTLGLTAKTIPEFAALGPKQAAAQMLITTLPGWLSALLFASFTAVILSTFAMTALAPATIFAHDIYKRFYRPESTEKEIALVTRIVIVALAIVAIAVASALPPIVAAINWLVAWLIPIFFVVVWGFFWKRSAIAAVITLSAAWLANLAWSFTPLPSYLNIGANFPNSYVVLIVTLTVGIFANLISAGSPAFAKAEAQ